MLEYWKQRKASKPRKEALIENVAFDLENWFKVT